MIFLRILRESFNFAIHALRVNKLRTILSLLGITIGIFSIILVFTVVDSLERNIRESLSSLGSNVVYIQKMPWSGGPEGYAWWKYFQRPEPNYQELEELQRRATTIRYAAYAFGINKTLKYKTNNIENATVLPVSHEYYDIWTYDLKYGRYFSPIESQSGSPVALLGSDIAEGLFGEQDPVGKEVKMMGRKVKVIGTFEKQGQSLVGQNIDEFMIVPVNFIRRIMSVENNQGAFIMAMAAPGVEVEEMLDDLRGAMRSIRKLKPKADDNFALNEISVLSAGLDAVFRIVGIAGLCIGGFSILIGGFGIANIMFVSVRERTNQIGIQKSLGAKNYFILLQFLLESIVLCIVGGLIGLVLVYLMVLVIGPLTGFDIIVSTGNVITGVLISIVIGLISGFVPAFMASRLDPVEAIRMGQ